MGGSAAIDCSPVGCATEQTDQEHDSSVKDEMTGRRIHSTGVVFQRPNVQAKPPPKAVGLSAGLGAMVTEGAATEAGLLALTFAEWVVDGVARLG